MYIQLWVILSSTLSLSSGESPSPTPSDQPCELLCTGGGFPKLNSSTSEQPCELLCTLTINMEKISFDQSLKNIPVPDKKTYCEELIQSLEKVIKSFRWKAKFFLKPSKVRNR